jgi:hypothetical protein
MSQARRSLYRWARLLGDLEAAEKGPGPLGRRLVRKAVYRRTGGLTRRLLRSLGL